MVHSSIRLLVFRQSIVASLFNNIWYILSLLILSAISNVYTLKLDPFLVSIFFLLIFKDLFSEVYMLDTKGVTIFTNLFRKKINKKKIPYETIAKVRTKSKNPIFEEIELILENDENTKLKNIAIDEHLSDLILNLKNSDYNKKKDLLKLHRFRKPKAIKNVEIIEN